MMDRATNKIAKLLAITWLSFLLLLGNTPMEFIHLFADHTDTVHVQHKGLVIEKKHHHCAYLSLTLTSFINDHHIPFIFYSTLTHTSRYSCATVHYVQRSIIEAALRGPPCA